MTKCKNLKIQKFIWSQREKKSHSKKVNIVSSNNQNSVDENQSGKDKRGKSNSAKMNMFARTEKDIHIYLGE